MTGKRVLVTGSGTGIGHEIALEFARQGADVVVHYAHDQNGAQAAVRTILDLGRRATAFRADFDRVEEAARLGEQDRGKRVHEGEVAAVAGRMERRRRFGEMLAHDPRVADLFVAEGQLVMGQTDGARLVRHLGVLQRARVQRDRP